MFGERFLSEMPLGEDYAGDRGGPVWGARLASIGEDGGDDGYRADE